VLVLIDLDAEGFLVGSSPYITKCDTYLSQFQDKYITKKAQGGEALADELLIRTREYLRPQFEDADNLDIIVRVYANLEGLAKYLVRQDKISNLGSLRAMSTSFSGRIASFDFVDVGVGKEGSSGRKIRGGLTRYSCVVTLLTYIPQRTSRSLQQIPICDMSSLGARPPTCLLLFYRRFLSTKSH
jgi:hypothetical protein